MNQIWNASSGSRRFPGPSAFQCAVAITLMVGVLLLILERRLRPVQVIS